MDNRTERQKYDDWAEKEKFITTGLESHAGWLAWLAAKHDAKPVVEIHTTHYANSSCYVALLDGRKLNVFWNECDAKNWIKANGYRLE